MSLAHKNMIPSGKCSYEGILKRENIIQCSLFPFLRICMRIKKEEEWFMVIKQLGPIELKLNNVEIKYTFLEFGWEIQTLL